MFLSLAFNLGMLVFFKYGTFFVNNVNSVLNFAGLHLDYEPSTLLLPPAISFFTFASLSYVIDVYYERTPVCGSLRDYALFIGFFPKLLSGPIVRAGEFLPQLNTRFRASAEDIEIGLCYILMGAVKKLAIADQIAPHVGTIFASPENFNAATLILGALGYTVQIFCDFSGYSDIAIGCARILGLRFPENFQMPYSSRNIAEFWRRWHITLSRWFRDYLFLPLEMALRMRFGSALRVSINMMITMLLCGLWHGPSWNFVIWGAIHGLALVVHKIYSGIVPGNRKISSLRKSIGGVSAHFLTMGVIVVSMVFFRAATPSDAFTYLSRMISLTTDGARLFSPYILAGVASVALIHLLVHKDRNLAVELPQMRLVPRIVGYSGLLLILVVFGATDAAAFIYFQF